MEANGKDKPEHEYVAMETSSLYLQPRSNNNGNNNDGNLNNANHNVNNANESEQRSLLLQNNNMDNIDEAMSKSKSKSKSTLLNFIIFSMLFSANHGAVVACISLTSARLGDIGTTQNTVLYLSYTCSALFGSTYVIKTIGPYHSIIGGMFIYCIYILSYVLATIDFISSLPLLKDVTILFGGFIGGIGGGFLWTAQGTYFAKASEEYAKCLMIMASPSLTPLLTVSDSESSPSSPSPSPSPSMDNQKNIKDATSLFAGIFASIYLLEEVIMRLLSSFMIEVLNLTWLNVFTGYFIIAFLSSILMSLIVDDLQPKIIDDHGDDDDNVSDNVVDGDNNNGGVNLNNQNGLEITSPLNNDIDDNDNNNNITPTLTYQQPTPNNITQPEQTEEKSAFYKATVTFQMLLFDPKMKYMIPICAVFGLSSVFIITYVNGEVLRITLNDNNSIYVGILSSITSATAGIMSIVFGLLATKTKFIGNSTILVIGCLSFFMVSFLFIVIPDLNKWNIAMLVLVYALQGVGRSTFEGVLKAEFALVFTEKEGAFGNIIFQNGLVTTVGFFLVSHLYCNAESTYCVKFNADGLLHNILIFEILIVTSAILAIFGYWRAKWMHNQELKEEFEQEERRQMEHEHEDGHEEEGFVDDIIL